MKLSIPKEIKNIFEKLEKQGFESFAVGGCVRDLIMGKDPEDWDITTNASPEKIQEIFPDCFYENNFGTVTVKTESEDPALKTIQITPYRIEAKYTDKRHPDEIKFAEKLEEDLSRRDFTINALALSKEGKIIDLFDGQKDIKGKKIRTVGNPESRFGEDALRLLRAVRFATVLGFEIEEKTLEAIKEKAVWLKMISMERIRDEFIKIINSKNADKGIEILRKTGLLNFIVPELLEGVDVEQNLHHIYSVWEHNVRALRYAVEKNYSTDVKIASLFHDIAKPRTKRGEGKYATFYGHDVVGAKMTVKILERLKFPKKQIEKIARLVRWHLFYYNVDEVTERSVRRLLTKMGKEDMKELIRVREADRIGSGVPKAKPYKLRHLEYVIDKVSSDPISAKMLAIDGNDLMKELGLEPGPKIGLLLSSLLASVLEDPALNKKDKLVELAKKLKEKSDKELQKNINKIEEEIEKEEEERKKKYYV